MDRTSILTSLRASLATPPERELVTLDRERVVAKLRDGVTWARALEREARRSQVAVSAQLSSARIR